MERAQLSELLYISPIENVSSIMTRGLLSHRRADRVPHQSIAMPEIQRRRSRKQVPGGSALHEYVNLYINARNTMMYARHELHETLCIIRVDPAVLDLPLVAISDQNAASDYARFHPSPSGLRYIDRERVFARSWKHPDDQREEWRHESSMCAEVLVPDRVAVALVLGAYVSCESAAGAIKVATPDLPVKVYPYLFFASEVDSDG